MWAFSAARLTVTACTPRRFFTAPSTVATHDAQDIPSTGSVVSATVPGRASDAPWMAGVMALPPSVFAPPIRIWLLIVLTIMPMPRAFVASPNRMTGTLYVVKKTAAPERPMTGITSARWWRQQATIEVVEVAVPPAAIALAERTPPLARSSRRRCVKRPIWTPEPVATAATRYQSLSSSSTACGHEFEPNRTMPRYRPISATAPSTPVAAGRRMLLMTVPSLRFCRMPSADSIAGGHGCREQDACQHQSHARPDPGQEEQAHQRQCAQPEEQAGEHPGGAIGLRLGMHRCRPDPRDIPRHGPRGALWSCGQRSHRLSHRSPPMRG